MSRAFKLGLAFKVLLWTELENEMLKRDLSYDEKSMLLPSRTNKAKRCENS